MRPGEADPYLSPTDADDSPRRRPKWRRLVAAAVMGAFTLMLVTLGFNRYAHHPAYGLRPALPSINLN